MLSAERRDLSLWAFPELRASCLRLELVLQQPSCDHEAIFAEKQATERAWVPDDRAGAHQSWSVYFLIPLCERIIFKCNRHLYRLHSLQKCFSGILKLNHTNMKNIQNQQCGWPTKRENLNTASHSRSHTILFSHN